MTMFYLVCVLCKSARALAAQACCTLAAQSCFCSLYPRVHKGESHSRPMMFSSGLIYDWVRQWHNDPSLFTLFFFLVSKIKQLSLGEIVPNHPPGTNWPSFTAHHAIRNGFPTKWISVWLGPHSSTLIQFVWGDLMLVFVESQICQIM